MSYIRCGNGDNGGGGFIPDGKFLMLYSRYNDNDNEWMRDSNATACFLLTPNQDGPLSNLDGATYSQTQAKWYVSGYRTGNKYIIDKTKIPFTKFTIKSTSGGNSGFYIFITGIGGGNFTKYPTLTFSGTSSQTIDLNSINEDIVIVQLYENNYTNMQGTISFSN